ncbi:MAG: alpha/beta hydrolase, partial [Desulfobacterales bacterium]|nr:alpha/beta hydrolase [Desulfobacterales bacterium]
YYLFPETVFKLAVDAQRRSAGLVKKEFRVDGQKLVYLEGGKGQKVLLLHGFGGNKDAWTIFAKYLKGYHLFIPDIPGFGESAKVQAYSYDVDSQVGRIARFIEVLKLDTFHIAGNSMGGALAALYGAAHPEKVLSIALMNTAGAPSPNKSEFVTQWEKGNNLFLIRNIEDYDRLMDLIFVKRPTIPASFKKILAADWIANTEFNMKIWEDMLAGKTSEFSVGPALSQVHTPILIIWGDQDKLTDLAGVALLEKYLKNYKTIVMKDTGHVPPIEKPEETAEISRNFLKEKI